MTKTIFTTEQQEAAATLASEIQTLIGANRDHKSDMETNFVELGIRLATAKATGYWRAFGFKNFSAFMLSLEGRSQNYRCYGVAQDLLPFVSKEDLVKMGITKASVLRLLKKGGKVFTLEIIDLAKSGTAEQLEGAVAKELGLVEDEEKGEWFAFGGARMDAAEKEEFLRTMNIVVQEAEMSAEAITNWQELPSMRKKQILQLLCAEFLSTYVPAA